MAALRIKALLPVAGWALMALSCSSSPLGPLLVLETGGGVSIAQLDGSSMVLEESNQGIFSQQPTWSPDGRLAVWTAIDQANQEFWIAMGDLDNQRRIETPTAPFYYAWSPDGSLVAFLGNAPAEQGVALGIIDVASGEAKLIDGGAPYYLDWHPDGKSLAIHVAGRVLALVDLEGVRTEIPVVTGPFQTPAFLPDGRLLVRGLDGLALVDPAGLTVPLAPVSGITMFSATGRGDRVAYTDSGPGQGLGELRVVETEAGEPTVVDPGPVAGFEWDPTGANLLFFTLDLNAGQLIPKVWDGAQARAYPGYTPSPAFVRQYLPFWDQYTRSLTLWSPNGDAFIVADADQGILIQRLDADLPTPVADGLFASWGA
jgi:hypothetical protein